MMTATEMRAKAMKVNDDARKAKQNEAIKWVETTAFKEIETTANKGMFVTLLSVKGFDDNQKKTIYNHFRKYGFEAGLTDTETLRVKW